MRRFEVREAQRQAVAMLEGAGIALTHQEAANVEVADFGLGRLRSEGLQIVVYENNDRYCAKELVMFSHQTCPEHLHPSKPGKPGKTETFRCRKGVVYLYTAGDPTETAQVLPPQDNAQCYTVFSEHVLTPGEQYTIGPDVLHWFKAGPDGAIVSEFSSTSTDGEDIFTDPNVKRTPAIED